MAYLVQGFFFQNHQRFGIAYRAESEGGVGVTIQTAMMGFMFSAVLAPDTEQEELIGQMIDDFGEAIVSNIEIAPDVLSFTKRYTHRPDDIHYSFKRNGAFWSGTYSGAAVGGGTANCILTQVPDEFFALPILHDD